MEPFLIVLLLALVGAVAALVWFYWLKPSGTRGSNRRSDPRSRQPLQLGSQVHFDTQTRLYRLLAGDRDAAERLVQQARRQHPDRPDQWLWQKVIEDLERDRRRG